MMFLDQLYNLKVCFLSEEILFHIYFFIFTAVCIVHFLIYANNCFLHFVYNCPQKLTKCGAHMQEIGTGDAQRHLEL